MCKQPIFLLGNHKSGTSLLRSLFDDINNLFVLPIETHPFQLLGYKIKYPYRKQRGNYIDKTTFIKNASEWINKANLSDDKYSDSQTLNLFNEDVFNKKLKEKLSFNTETSNIINSYFESIYCSVHSENNEIDNSTRCVEKSVENFEFAIDLNRLFPEAKFIHIIRNPYSNLVSLRKYKGKVGYPYLDRVLKALDHSFYYLSRNKRVIENYYILKYEDLVSQPELKMKEVCEFLGIPFQHRLLEPTVLGGVKWKGNSLADVKFEGISNERMNSWKSEIYPLEIKFVNKLFPDILKDFDYELQMTEGSIYRPMKNKKLKAYLFNRILYKKAESIF